MQTRDYKHILTVAALPVIIWIFYSGMLITEHHTLYEVQATHNYYKNFALAFMDGRTYLDDCPEFSFCHDLVRYNDKLYMYWPPAPVFIYMPLVKIFGLHTPDNLIDAIVGSLNVLLFYLFLYRLGKRFPGFKWRYTLVLALLFGLGTVHFYLSMFGEVWFFGEVMAQFFLLLSLLLLLSRRTIGLLLSGLFFALAAYTRNTLLFSFIFIAVVYITTYQPRLDKKLLGHSVLYLMPFVIFSIANLCYNHARFGSIFENGLTYHQMDKHFAENFKTHGFFSLHYIPGNALRELLWPLPTTSKFPFFMTDPEGIGMFCVSPLLVLVFPAGYFLYKKYRQSADKKLLSYAQSLLGLSSIISAICIALVIFSIMGSGYEQFGARYTLDFEIFIIVPILLYLQGRQRSFPFWALSALLLVSIYIQFIGAKMYFNML